jgi:hypothetical protein
MARDFLVDVGNPAALDATLGRMGAHLVQAEARPGYLMVDGHYVMRAVSADPGFLRFACESQGYCTIVGELDELV